MKLVKYEAAKTALATIVKIDEVKRIKDKATAMEAYAYQARDPDLASYSAEVKKRATRRLGVLMKEQPKARSRSGGRSGKNRGGKNPPRFPKLEDQGVDKDLAKAARKEADLTEEQFEASVDEAKELAEAAASGDKAIIRAAKNRRHKEKKRRREEREQALAVKIQSLPEKKYGVIVADPEWKFEAYSERGFMNTAAANHYPVSSLDDIKSRDVASIAFQDAVLFLWATVPMLPHAIDVMTTWGFAYKSHLAWIKDRAGTGYWSRNKHEILLIGTTGKIVAPAEGTQPESAIYAPVGEHSAKPDIFLQIIEEWFPNVPKIELNRRGPARPGWDAWGNEAEQCTQTAAE